jgi:rod shape-determining protein MreC
LVLVVLNLPPATTARLKLAMGGLFLPLFGLSSAGQQAAAQGAAALLPRGELLRENARLNQENEQLRVRATQADELRRENDRLSRLLGWQQRAPWKLKLAHVVARDTVGWWRTIQIDLGTRDHVTNNSPVLTSAGLVGRVLSAGLTSSQVVLVVETRDNGMIAPGPGAPFDKSLVILTSLPNNSELKPGQSIITSGLGQIFPKGITVGTVVDVRTIEFGLYKEAEVKLGANLSALEEVLVMVP